MAHRFRSEYDPYNQNLGNWRRDSSHTHSPPASAIFFWLCSNNPQSNAAWPVFLLPQAYVFAVSVDHDPDPQQRPYIISGFRSIANLSCQQHLCTNDRVDTSMWMRACEPLCVCRGALATGVRVIGVHVSSVRVSRATALL
jgi:hypothetical protein